MMQFTGIYNCLEFVKIKKLLFNETNNRLGTNIFHYSVYMTLESIFLVFLENSKLVLPTFQLL